MLDGLVGIAADVVPVDLGDSLKQLWSDVSGGPTRPQSTDEAQRVGICLSVRVRGVDPYRACVVPVDAEREARDEGFGQCGHLHPAQVRLPDSLPIRVITGEAQFYEPRTGLADLDTGICLGVPLATYNELQDLWNPMILKDDVLL